MSNIVIPFAAVSQAQVPSVGFNNNFTEIASKFNSFAVQTDVAKTITVAHTFSVAQNFAGATYTGDLLFTDALYDIGKAGLTRPRDGFFSRNVVIGGTLTVTGAITGSAPAGSLSGTTLAAGVTLSSLTTLGTLAVDLKFTDATFDIGKSGATRPRDGFFSRNVVVGGTVTVGGNMTFSQVDTKVTINNAIDFRMAADAGSAFLITDSGVCQLSNGYLVLRTPTTASPQLLLPSGVAPTTPTDGMMWRVGAQLFLHDGSTTKSVTFV